jgi:hypothetical protein
VIRRYKQSINFFFKRAENRNSAATGIDSLFCVLRVPIGPGFHCIFFSLYGDVTAIYRDRRISYHERTALLLSYSKTLSRNRLLYRYGVRYGLAISPKCVLPKRRTSSSTVASSSSVSPSVSTSTLRLGVSYISGPDDAVASCGDVPLLTRSRVCDHTSNRCGGGAGYAHVSDRSAGVVCAHIS